MKYAVLLLVLVSGCFFTNTPMDALYADDVLTWTPSRNLGDVYCEPVHEDILLCREDNGTTFRCVNARGVWTCKRLP